MYLSSGCLSSGPQACPTYVLPTEQISLALINDFSLNFSMKQSLNIVAWCISTSHLQLKKKNKKTKTPIPLFQFSSSYFLVSFLGSLKLSFSCLRGLKYVFILCPWVLISIMVAQLGEIVETSSGPFPLNNRAHRGTGVCFVKSVQLVGGRAKPGWSLTYSQPSALSTGWSFLDLFPIPNFLQRNLLSPDQHLSFLFCLCSWVLGGDCFSLLNIL